MEVPNGTKRWDEPLFTVREHDSTPLEQITQVSTAHQLARLRDHASPIPVHSYPPYSLSSSPHSLFSPSTQWLLHGKQQNPGLATLPAQLEDITYLQTLERTVNAISHSLIHRQQQQLIHPGDDVPIEHSAVRLRLVRAVKYAELRRVQVQFVKIARLRPMQGEAAIATSFVAHLQNALNY